MTSPPTALSSALASPPFHTYATGENGGARPSLNANAHANVLPTATTFATQAPQLTSEKAHSTALFLAYEELCLRVAAWSTLLAQDLASSDATSPVLEAPALVAATSRPSKTSLPDNSSTQTAGEAATACGSRPTTQPQLGGPGFQRTNPVSSFVPPQPLVHSTVESRELLASSGPASAPSSHSNPRDATSTTSKFYEQAAARVPNTSENGHANTLSTKTPTLPTLPTPTSTPTLPPWLEAHVEVFFNEHLARAIQIRESQLVNTIHECVQHELQRLQRRVQALEHHASESDKTRAHLQSKLDRRVEESNALRKEYYRHLLMLRDLVGKRRHDPRTLKAVEDEIAAVVQGGDASATTTAKTGAAWLYPRAQTRDESGATGNVGSTAAITATASSMGMRKEKEKWEERAREAAAECQQLHEQVLVLRQQLEEARGLDGELWFATAQHGLYERQRMIDSVYKSKCTWAQVGDAILELVNNELVWEAVETSAFRDKGRVSRGLEALILRAESLGVSSPTGDVAAGLDDAEMANDSVSKRGFVRRRSSGCFGEGSRVIMCRTCNGCGYLDAAAWTANHQVGAPNDEEDGSYLRKTLAQVLELKTSLEEATTRANHAEQELLRTVMEGAQMKEMMEKIEHARAHRMDSCLQVDMDEDEEISVDDIMNAHSGPGGGSSTRGGGRWKQYEHLIVELKNLLSERDAGLAQLRKSVADSQSRLMNLQKTSQKDQERLQRELQTLKGSLALAMSSRNHVIEEKQAAVNQLLQSLDRQQSQSAFSSKRVLLLPRASQNRDTDAINVDGNNDVYEECGDEDEGEKGDGDEDEDEVTRTERMARRYSLAVGRVQREHDEQQQRLEQTEKELGTEAEKRKRTNSIMLGGLAVSMASHPRDLFKALSSTHQELLNYRRSSQRASALQTDRLLTLTTHLAHISEELVMVKKRTSVEIEFWKLDCEKLQNSNRALAADLETAHQMIDEANERTAQANARNAMKVCVPCAKHEERLLAISAMLLKETAGGGDGANGGREASVGHQPSSAQTANAAQLSEVERHGLGAILLDLENLYSTLSSSKQRHAKEAIARALLSGNGQSNLPDSFSSLQDGSSRLDNERTTGLFQAPSARPDGSVSVEDSNSKRSSQVAAPSVRLFQDSFTASLQRDSQSCIAVQGSSISTPVFMENNLQTHHRKTIVRKVLSEQEALIRQRAASRRGHHPSRNLNDATGGKSITERTPGPVSVDTPEMDEPDDGIPVYSTYVDEDGKEVFYVDVEEEECGESDSASPDAPRGSAVSTNATDPLPIMATSVQVAASHRLDLSFQIPSPDHPIGGPMCAATREHHEAEVIDKDPEMIQKLRELVNNNATARELLALMNWRIFVSHFQAYRDQRRLDFVNATWRTASASGLSSASTNSLPQAVRTTMQKLVQWREVALDDAVRQRDELRKQSRRAQTHLIHCVSTVLTNLTRKSKTGMIRSDSHPLVHIDPQTYSPRRSPGPMHLPLRPLYPSTRVNLSEIPPTQHVPTPSFPLPMELPTLNESQSVGTTREASLTPIRASGDQESINETPWTPSIFENDNRFPQRSVKFVPVGGGDDLSLMHSTSPLPVSSQSNSPSKSPSRAGGLSVDAIRRPIHSAGPTLGGSFNPPLSVDPAAPHFLDLFSRRPVRPQSSPAGPRTHFRPSSATASRIESGMLEGEVRPPEHSAVRPTVVLRGQSDEGGSM